MQEFQSSTMVGVTTEQNTANLVPAVLLGVRHFIAVDSARASGEQWGEGAKRILTNRGVTCDTITLGPRNDSTIQAVQDQIRQALREKGLAERPIVWVLGGGLKPQQLAVYGFLLERAPSSGDVGFYADPGRARSVLVRVKAGGGGG